MSDATDWAVPLVIGLVMIGGGAFLFVSNQEATANAEAVEATVLTSEVYDAEPGDPPNDRTDDDYRAKVEYEYAYDGRTYTSENLCPGAGESCAPTGETPGKAEKFLQQYPEGETVTAYVQPDEPSTAYLVEGGSPLPYLGLAGAGVVVTILGGRKLLSG